MFNFETVTQVSAPSRSLTALFAKKFKSFRYEFKSAGFFSVTLTLEGREEVEGLEEFWVGDDWATGEMFLMSETTVTLRLKTGEF